MLDMVESPAGYVCCGQQEETSRALSVYLNAEVWGGVWQRLEPAGLLFSCPFKGIAEGAPKTRLELRSVSKVGSLLDPRRHAGLQDRGCLSWQGGFVWWMWVCLGRHCLLLLSDVVTSDNELSIVYDIWERMISSVMISWWLKKQTSTCPCAVESAHLPEFQQLTVPPHPSSFHHPHPHPHPTSHTQ